MDIRGPHVPLQNCRQQLRIRMGDGADCLVSCRRTWIQQSIWWLNRTYRVGTSAVPMADLHHFLGIRGVLESSRNRVADLQQHVFRIDVYPNFSDRPADFLGEGGPLVSMGVGVAAERDFLVHSLDMGDEFVGATPGDDRLARAHS